MDHIKMAKSRSYEETLQVISDAAAGIGSNTYIWMNGRITVLRAMAVEKAYNEGTTLSALFTSAGLGAGFSSRLGSRDQRTIRVKSFVLIAKRFGMKATDLYEELTKRINGKSTPKNKKEKKEESLPPEQQLSQRSDQMIEIWLKPSGEWSVVLPFTQRSFSVDADRARAIMQMLFDQVDTAPLDG